MRQYDNLPNFTHFDSIDDMPEGFTGNFGIPREHFREKFYMKYPTYWEEYEHRGTVRAGVLTIDGEPMPAIVLLYKKAVENTPENP